MGTCELVAEFADFFGLLRGDELSHGFLGSSPGPHIARNFALRSIRSVGVSVSCCE